MALCQLHTNTAVWKEAYASKQKKCQNYLHYTSMLQQQSEITKPTKETRIG